MSKKSNQKKRDNEAVVRALNEKVQKQMKHADGGLDNNEYKTLKLSFLCECSDLNCNKRVRMTAYEYEQYHEERDFFVVEKGHDDKAVESPILLKSDYVVVQKSITPDENPDIDINKALSI